MGAEVNERQKLSAGSWDGPDKGVGVHPFIYLLLLVFVVNIIFGFYLLSITVHTQFCLDNYFSFY